MNPNLSSYDATVPLRLKECPVCKRRLSSLPELACEDCLRKMNEVRKKASALKGPEGRVAARSDEAPPRSEKRAKDGGRLYALSWFEVACFGGGIAIWISSLTSEFYFALTVMIVVALAVIALLVEGKKIR